MNYILFIYLLINYTEAVYHIGNEWGFSNSNEKVYECLRFVWMCLFGCIVYICYAIAGIGVGMFTYFQIKFFWYFIFTKKYHNLDPEIVNLNQDLCKKHYTENNFRHWLVRYCHSLVAKRNKSS